MKKNYRRTTKNTVEDMKNAVLEDPFSIKKFKNVPDEIIKIALREDVGSIQYIKNNMYSIT